MTFLSFWSPSAFTAVLDYCEATDWGWSGFDPDLIPDPDGDDPDGGPAPVCARCGGDLGIFLKFGLDWRHYRGEGLDDLELYDPGHAPEITWRAPASPPGRPDTDASQPPASPVPSKPRGRAAQARGLAVNPRTADLLYVPRWA